MSKLSKILFFVAALSLALVIVPRVVLGGWIDALYIPLAMAVASLVGALAIDFRNILEFLTMRTTKHGLNMGSLIVLTLALLVAINFVGVKKNHSWDITEEKLNSLSDQSVEIVKSANGDIVFTIFFRGDNGRKSVSFLRENLRLYQAAGKSVTVRSYDAFVENTLAQQYLNDLPDRDSSANEVFLFVEVAGKRERIQSPFDETQITQALVRATRKSNKTIYVLRGHGERDVDGQAEEGLSAFKKELEGQAAKVLPLSLLDGSKIPEDAALIIVPGPSSPLLDGELEALREYARAGGKLMVLADPGQRHNLAQLLRTFGIDFANTFVINGKLMVMGVSQVTVVGLDFDRSHDITKRLDHGNSYGLFHLVSEVKKGADAPADLKYTELVKTSPKSLMITELSEKAKPAGERAYTLALAVSGKLKKADGQPSEKEFQAVVVGDSDFVTNKLFFTSANRDLAMNAVATLVGEGDLITIRPKSPKQTKLTMTQNQQFGVVAAGIMLPIGLIVIGSLVWIRRRSA